jgi:hypothetical protein
MGICMCMVCLLVCVCICVHICVRFVYVGVSIAVCCTVSIHARIVACCFQEAHRYLYVSIIQRTAVCFVVGIGAQIEACRSFLKRYECMYVYVYAHVYMSVATCCKVLRCVVLLAWAHER